MRKDPSGEGPVIKGIPEKASPEAGEIVKDGKGPEEYPGEDTCSSSQGGPAEGRWRTGEEDPRASVLMVSCGCNDLLLLNAGES